ncbi:MerR family DNA-binding transcriptional regulator [Streptomyces nanshensis]|uniref:MerR family DNA-binding transcriptional regulator n=1 Tax=Streptomyces nanshensis TaxID=518642 RepID=UPI00085C732B
MTDGESGTRDGAEERTPAPEAARATARLRPVDLARAAGISAQQVRNYEASGVLPPALRTDSGYRVFTERHRRALLAYRALVRGLGPGAAQSVMLALHGRDRDGDDSGTSAAYDGHREHEAYDGHDAHNSRAAPGRSASSPPVTDDGVARALALVDEGHASLHEQRRALHETAQALQLLAAQDPEASRAPRSDLLIGEVAARLGVRASALRVWEEAGLLTPRRDPETGYRRYGARELRDARLVDMLRRSRYPLPRVVEILDGLRRSGSTDELRAAVAQRRAELDRRARALLEAAGLLHAYLTDAAPPPAT